MAKTPRIRFDFNMDRAPFHSILRCAWMVFFDCQCVMDIDLMEGHEWEILEIRPCKKHIEMRYKYVPVRSSNIR
jgi:hypothetical protein